MSGAIFNLAVGPGLIFMLRRLQPYIGMVPVPANLNFLVDLVGMFICSCGVTPAPREGFSQVPSLRRLRSGM